MLMSPQVGTVSCLMKQLCVTYFVAAFVHVTPK